MCLGVGENDILEAEIYLALNINKKPKRTKFSAVVPMEQNSPCTRKVLSSNIKEESDTESDSDEAGAWRSNTQEQHNESKWHPSRLVSNLASTKSHHHIEMGALSLRSTHDSKSGDKLHKLLGISSSADREAFAQELALAARSKPPVANLDRGDEKQEQEEEQQVVVQEYEDTLDQFHNQEQEPVPQSGLSNSTKDNCNQTRKDEHHRSKAHKVLGCSQLEVQRRKALKLLGVTEEELFCIERDRTPFHQSPSRNRRSKTKRHSILIGNINPLAIPSMVRSRTMPSLKKSWGGIFSVSA